MHQDTPPPSNLRWAGAIAGAWLTVVTAGSIIAVAMAPWLAPTFGAAIRDPDTEGLLWPALLGGYAVVAALVVWTIAQTAPRRRRGAATAGVVVGLGVFVGDHLVTAGWSTLPAWSMLASGFADALACVPAALVGHAILRT